MALFSILLEIGSCRNQAGSEFSLPKAERPGPTLKIDFGRSSILDDNLTPVTAPPLLWLPKYLDELSYTDQPGVTLSSDELCLTARSSFYHQQEEGLRLRFCSAALRSSHDRIVNTIATILTADRPGSFPLFRSEQLEIRAEKLTTIVKRGAALATVDGTTEVGRLAASGLKGQLLHFESQLPLNHRTIQDGALPRTFISSNFSLVINHQSLLLLYELTNSSDYLVIDIRDATIRNTALQALGRIVRVERELLEKSARQSAFLSEIYFPIQGDTSAAFIEIGGGESSGGIIQVGLEAEPGVAIELEAFLFRDSVLVVSPAEFDFYSSILFKDHISQTQNSISYLDFAHLAVGDKRSLSATDSKLNQLSPTTTCLSGAICSNRGFHPRQIAALLELRRRNFSAELPRCQPEDFALSEWNPFGIIESQPLSLISSGSYSPGGKFLELQVLRDCQGGDIIFRADDILLDPGDATLHQNQLLLYVADKNFFAGGQENYRLRSLKPVQSIIVQELSSGRQRSLNTPFGPNYNFIAGDRNYSQNSVGSAFFRRVHSLINCPNSSCSSLTYHGHSSAGLRPDLQAEHAMSPGHPNPGDFLPAELQLSEVLPGGGRSDSGVSLPEEEYIEFKIENSSTASPGAGHYRLEITRLSDFEERHYLFPLPRRPTSGQDRFFFITGNSQCRAPSTQAIYYPSLYLPNSPGSYRLYNRSETEVSALIIDAKLYSLLDTPELRRSLERVAEADSWQPADPLAAFYPPCSLTAGSPGDAPRYRPFFLRQNSSPGLPEYRFYSTEGSHQLELSIYQIFGQPLHNASRLLSAGDLFIYDLPLPESGSRFLLQISEPTRTAAPILLEDEIYSGAPELIVSAIAATPQSGGHEWLRLCSPGGFPPPNLARLLIQDSSAIDEIVSWQSRNPDRPLASALIQNSLALDANRCALLLDPDHPGDNLPLTAADQAIWSIASSSAIGNGLGSGEAIVIYSEDPGGAVTPLATFGRPDTTQPFAIPTVTGEYIIRRENTIHDRQENYQVVKP